MPKREQKAILFAHAYPVTGCRLNRLHSGLVPQFFPTQHPSCFNPCFHTLPKKREYMP
jgi:hypothetical protein